MKGIIIVAVLLFVGCSDDPEPPKYIIAESGYCVAMCHDIFFRLRVDDDVITAPMLKAVTDSCKALYEDRECCMRLYQSGEPMHAVVCEAVGLNRCWGWAGQEAVFCYGE